MVDITGMVSRDGCHERVAPVGGVDLRYTNVPDINGTYILSQVDPSPFSCKWETKLIASYTTDVYSSTDGTCVGLTNTLNTTQLIFRIVYTGTVFRFDILAKREGIDVIRVITPYSPETGCTEVSDLALIAATLDVEFDAASAEATITEL